MSVHWHDDEYVWWCDCEDERCACGHGLARHDMGHGCIECRCRGFTEPPK